MTVSPTLEQLASQGKLYIHTVGIAEFFLELHYCIAAQNRQLHNNTDHSR
jgi:hypothetical protein